MKILITGICGFVGSCLAETLRDRSTEHEIFGVDNLSRAGSEGNRRALRHRGVRVYHGDVRSATDVDSLPDADWVIDAAANPSVLAGVGGGSSSRQVVEHNLFGTVNLLEYCKRRRAGFILLSTSRVYSIPPLARLPVEVIDGAFRPARTGLPPGLSAAGLNESFSTAAPVSLYGATKLASEQLALEYADAFEFPVYVNRCGVLAGAGQFGRADQGIFSYWIHAYRGRRPLRYIGFGGHGYQVRDCLHPRDLVSLLRRQMDARAKGAEVVNVGGGMRQSLSLAQLSQWCEARFGRHEIAATAEQRQFDLPWLVLDSNRAAQTWQWQPETPLGDILEEIAQHAERNPNWLDLVAGDEV